MLGHRPSYYWLFSWRYLAPITMVVIFISNLIEIFQKGTSYSAWHPELVRTILVLDNGHVHFNMDLHYIL